MRSLSEEREFLARSWRENEKARLGVNDEELDHILDVASRIDLALGMGGSYHSIAGLIASDRFKKLLNA